MEEAKLKGVKLKLEKYDLYPATYYYWKRKFVVHGEDGLNHRTNKDLVSENKRLEKENERLKILLGQKELESALKDEVIKKSTPSGEQGVD